MVRIADHHKPGSWRYDAGNPYEPSGDWPEECYVQWGGGGLVLKKEGGSYNTAFFEAFPEDNSGGFIRGEGATVADAEASALKKWRTQAGCHHRWCRKKYTNGGAICAHCGAFKSVFQPIYEMEAWKKPITTWQDGWLEMMAADRTNSKLRRKMELRKNLFGVEPEPNKPKTKIELFVHALLGE